MAAASEAASPFEHAQTSSHMEIIILEALSDNYM